jgi:hypothetical protein
MLFTFKMSELATVVIVSRSKIMNPEEVKALINETLQNREKQWGQALT